MPKTKFDKYFYLGGINEMFCAIAIFLIPLFVIATSFLIIKDDKSLGAIALSAFMVLGSLFVFL